MSGAGRQDGRALTRRPHPRRRTRSRRRPRPARAGPRRSRRPGPRSTVTSAPEKSVSSSTSALTASSSPPLASSQALTRPGTALALLGDTRDLPKVATTPPRSAAWRGVQDGPGEGQHRVVAVGQRGGTRVVGLAVEVEPPAAVRPDGRGDADLGVPVAPGPAPARCGVRRRRRCAAGSPRPGPGRRGRAPPGAAPRPASRPRRRFSARALSGSRIPVSSREPTHGTPNRAPSSSAKQAMPRGRTGWKSPARSRSRAAKADTTPRGPSKAPPCRTESRWLPVTTPGRAEGSPHQAHRLPLRSSLRSRPRLAASCPNHRRSSRSAGDHASRR